MRLRRSMNLVLALALLAAGGAAWYAQRGETGPPPLTGLQPGDIQSIALTFPRAEGAPLRLQRRRDGWHILEPIERAARDGRVVTALTVLRAPARSCYPVADHEPAEFGLDRPHLRMEVEGTTIAFGDRAADGRRYVRAGERFCLLPDQFWPLLKRGLDGLAVRSLLGTGRAPTRIATPRAEARIEGDNGGWRLTRGSGDSEAWAAAWRGARADGFVLDPPDTDRGRIRVATEGAILEWRIAAREPHLILVPTVADYGLRIAGDAAGRLLAPPRDATDDGSP
jgi:hypothetical protein